MSKSLNLFLPAIGGTALLLGLAIGIPSRDYGRDTIELLEGQVAAKDERIQSVAEEAEAAREALAALEAERETLLAQVAAGGRLTEPAPAVMDGFGLGREALPEEIAAWDVDVLPDGRGLPEGSGDVWTGEEVFVAQCAACHGDFAEGAGNWPALAGGFDTLANDDPVKTVGSYWPYLSTVWDYVHRSMPFGNAGTLSADETYAIVAYILYSNDMVDEDFVLSHENFTEVEMYNTDGFVIDDRPELEYAQWRTEPCMENCKDSVEITMHASVLDVTPETAAEPAQEASAPAAEPEAETEMAVAEEAAPAATAAAFTPEQVAAGEAAFRQCSSCHQVGANASNRTGPQLNGILGRTVGGVEGFRYSNTFADAAAAGDVWTVDSLSAFLADPRGAMAGTKMAFRGVTDPAEIEALIAYIDSAGGQ